MPIDVGDLRRRLDTSLGTRQAISAAAQRLGTTPRMLRYRERLGLLPARRGTGGHRVYAERELLAAACAIEIEQRYAVPPAAVAFALRLLDDPEAAADVRVLGTLTRRVAPTPLAALDFEAEKGRDLLRLRRPEGAD